MSVVRLPISGTDVALQSPLGLDELVLIEASALDLSTAVRLASRLAAQLDGSPIDVRELPLADLDALLLRLRQQQIGDVVRAETRCAAPECGAMVDVTFSIDDYLAHHAPERPDDVLAAEAGWYRLGHTGVRFRAPLVRDELAAADSDDPARDLLHRCVEAEHDLTDPAADHGIEAALDDALERVAPDLCGELSGSCIECGDTVAVMFDPMDFVLRELADRARPIYDEVSRIARSFHWSEAEILALPAMRREQYADLAGPRTVLKMPVDAAAWSA